MKNLCKTVEETENVDCCSICLEILTPVHTGTTATPTSTLPCQHCFHRECLSKLRQLGTSQTCPLCRAELPPRRRSWRERFVGNFLSSPETTTTALTSSQSSRNSSGSRIGNTTRNTSNPTNARSLYDGDGESAASNSYYYQRYHIQPEFLFMAAEALSFGALIDPGRTCQSAMQYM